MFVASANRPVFLRSGLPLLDRALYGGVRPGGITEVRPRELDTERGRWLDSLSA